MSTRRSQTLHDGATARWAVTLAATVVSIGVLDVAATVCGGLVVASSALDGASPVLVFGFLGVSYLVWAAGLRVNLIANYRPLETTGMSTSALSKVLFDIVQARSTRRWTTRAASVAGYVAVELVKEIPYYAGAVGAALATDSVDAADAVLFLGGANLGAAAYEYGVARLAGAYLDRWRRRATRGTPSRPLRSAYASFEADWSPRQYLADYYQFVEDDERATIAFFVDALKHAERDQPVLLFGIGPTMHHVFLAAEVASEIHVAEFLPANRQEVERWVVGDPSAHDWTAFVAYTLECEGLANPTPAQIAARERLTRSKVEQLLPGDARQADPLGGFGQAPYHTVISAFCADSATADKVTWEAFMRRIAGLVRPGGLFVTAALRGSTGYAVGGRWFPSACVDEDDLRRVLRPDFDLMLGEVAVHDLSEHREHGYTSIVLARAHRRTTTADAHREPLALSR